mmetsp:Transcript_4274/g.10881  ORF Transcript_4274/g.10881 Transcript_4274/m.10881 type:complete len:201 (+) Transcript_4274:1054-1656(+)
MAFPREEYAVEVSLGPARGDVSPVGIGLRLPQVGEEVDDRALELTAVDAVVGRDEGIAEVVDAVLHELVQLLVVVHEVVRIAEVHAALALEQLIVGAKDIGLAGQRSRLAFLVRGGDAHHVRRQHGLLLGREGIDDLVAGAPRVEYRPGGGGAGLGGIGGVILNGVSDVVVEVGFGLVSIEEGLVFRRRRRLLCRFLIVR